MKRIILVCLFVSLLFAAERAKFILPDLFVTAKDLRVLDAGAKPIKTVEKSWEAGNYINKDQGYLNTDNDIVDRINLEEVKTGLFFNEAQFWFGLPSYLSFSVYHGYEWEKKPYFIILNRTIGDQKYSGFTKKSGEFFVSIAWDEKNVINLKMLENTIDTARLNSIQAAWRTFWHIPILYQFKIFNAAANANTAVNSAVSYFQNNLALDIGDVSVLNTSFPSAVYLDFLNSNNNAYASVELLLNKELELFSAPNKLQFGINGWTNKGTTNLRLLLRDNLSFQLTENVQMDIALDISNSKIKVDDMFQFDLAEIDDPKIEPDEKAEIRITINNYFGIKESVLFSYTVYSNLKVWDDVPPSNGYYSRVNAKNVQILKLGALFKDVAILSENIDILVQLPIYNKDIPNQFSKFAEVSYNKALYDGMLNVVGSYYLRELGSSGFYKKGYFNIDISYDQSINPNFGWGLTVGNLLSSGAEKLSGLQIGSPHLYLKARFIF